MKLTLIRHGDTRATRLRLYYGSKDLALLPQSAQALAANAARYPKAPRYFTSGMVRTEQTFQAIYGPLPHKILPGLREMDFGRFEMHSYEELKDDPDYCHWCEDSEHLPCPGGEDARWDSLRLFPCPGPGLHGDVFRKSPGTLRENSISKSAFGYGRRFLLHYLIFTSK